MASLFSGPSSLTPWMEYSVSQALLRRPIEQRPKIAQVIAVRRNETLLSDGMSSIHLRSSTEKQQLPMGAVVRIRNWKVCCIQGECICLQAQQVDVLGGFGMGTVGNPVDVHQSIDVRRAIEFLRPTKPSQVLSPPTREKHDDTTASSETNPPRRILAPASTTTTRPRPLGNATDLLNNRDAFQMLVGSYKKAPSELSFRAYGPNGEAAVVVKDLVQMRHLFSKVLEGKDPVADHGAVAETEITAAARVEQAVADESSCIETTVSSVREASIGGDANPNDPAVDGTAADTQGEQEKLEGQMIEDSSCTMDKGIDVVEGATSATGSSNGATMADHGVPSTREECGEAHQGWGADKSSSTSNANALAATMKRAVILKEKNQTVDNGVPVAQKEHVVVESSSSNIDKRSNADSDLSTAQFNMPREEATLAAEKQRGEDKEEQIVLTMDDSPSRNSDNNSEEDIGISNMLISQEDNDEDAERVNELATPSQDKSHLEEIGNTASGTMVANQDNVEDTNCVKDDRDSNDESETYDQPDKKSLEEVTQSGEPSSPLSTQEATQEDSFEALNALETQDPSMLLDTGIIQAPPEPMVESATTFQESRKHKPLRETVFERWSRSRREPSRRQRMPLVHKGMGGDIARAWLKRDHGVQ